MDLSLKELREFAFFRNNCMSEKEEITGMIRPVAGLLMILFMIASHLFPINISLPSVLFLLLLLTAWYFHSINEIENDCRKKLEEEDKEKAKSFESLIQEARSNEFNNRKNKLSFNYVEHKQGIKKVISVAVIVLNDSVFMYHHGKDIIEIEALENFRIIREGKNILSGNYEAKMDQGLGEKSISISPRSYNTYLKCLKENFESEGAES